MIENESLTVEGGRHAAAQLVGMPLTRRPTGVVCANDLIALGHGQVLFEPELVVPASSDYRRQAGRSDTAPRAASGA